MTHPLPDGIAFPLAPDGSHSSTRAGAAILAAALEALKPGLGKSALAETHWRRRYPVYFRQMVTEGIRLPESALASAGAGLDAAWNTMCWNRDGTQIPIAGAMASPQTVLRPLCLKGQGDPALIPWSIPYRGVSLGGEALREKLGDWQDRGIIEPSAADALRRCLVHPEWFDLSDRHVVLLGAGSEAGPLRWLLRWRANVVALDVRQPSVWKRLAALLAASNGTLTVPVRGAAQHETGDWTECAGADLISESPEIAAWLGDLGHALDVGALAYLDGERHVRVSLGMDAVVRTVCARDSRTSLAFLATPTDVFAVKRETASAAIHAYHHRPVASKTFQSSLHLASGDRFFQPNVEELVVSGNGLEYGVADSLVIEQGPNYALAKRLQQWRALQARAAGHRVSLNVAPSTTTASVIKNPALAAGFAGAGTFGIEVFEPETTNALMAALWVHDLRFEGSAANPATPLAHPYELFMDNACHGGLWRMAYRSRSALPFAAVLGWVRKKVHV